MDCVLSDPVEIDAVEHCVAVVPTLAGAVPVVVDNVDSVVSEHAAAAAVAAGSHTCSFLASDEIDIESAVVA